MIPAAIQAKLRANWPRAESLDCNVECRLYDPGSHWQWLIYAQNPEAPDEMLAIEGGLYYRVASELSYEALQEIYNNKGDRMQLDADFAPRNAAFLWSQIKTRYAHEIETDVP